MAIEDGLCLAETIHAADGDFAAAFRPLRGRPPDPDGPRAAGIPLALGLLPLPAASTGTCATPPWRIGTRRIMFDCLAWLYDGVPRAEP